MKETRNFLRYLVPGLVFLFELFLLIIFSNYTDKFHDIWSKLTEIKNISAPLIILLASGCIGYLLSILHHCIYWSGIKLYPRADRRGVIERAIRGRRLEIYCQGHQKPLSPNCNLSAPGAWRVVTAIWHSRKRNEESSLFGSALARADSLSDLMHGAGSALIGSLLAVIFWILIEIFVFQSFWGIIKGISPSFLLILLHWWSYSIIVKHAQSFFDLVFYEALKHPFFTKGITEENPVIQYYVNQCDLENNKIANVELSPRSQPPGCGGAGG